MMNRKAFFEKVADIVKNDKAHNYLQKIQRAYWLAKLAHKGQTRDEGERYFEHCRKVALLFIEHINFINKELNSVVDIEKWHEFCGRFTIVTNRCFNSYCFSQIIMTALLHDCVEDCFIPEELLATECFDFVQTNVEDLSKVKPIFDSLTGSVKEKIRKTDDEYYTNISGNVFAGYVKIFDRLDNLRSMEKVWTKERQAKYIAETEKYILPIAEKTDKELHSLLLEQIAKIKQKGGE